MATNYNVKMAVEAIKSNDKESLIDCGRRFPLATMLLAKLVSKAPDEITEFASAIPEHISVRKIESILKDGVSETTEDEDVAETVDAETVEEKPVKEKKEKKERAPKKEKAAKKEEIMPEPIEDDNDSDDSEYSDMSAVDLFKLCKKRGIKTEPKQKSNVYINLLKKDDEKKAAPEATIDEDDEDWDI